ncbi:Uncharacterized membrane protein YckC, RDD family [Roseateles sp. YR242]|uniref:RDD family protein n=1 Tax=Roseateles sp. YR242 TaxID=1855305 RepID=UPI0008D29417|nr:RDD family protein [Roseateles sp. YR242]SEK62214.1 Uncharacterized membrane protein YckC, RDD family [Roseateles sp. YR242]
MSGTVDQRFAPPEAHVEDLAPATGTPGLAGRGTRLLAVIIDGLILAALLWVIGKIPGLPSGINPFADSNEDWSGWNLIPNIVSFGVFVLVQGWPLVKRGQTLGKMIFKLRIVRTDGSPVEVWRMLGLRYGIGYLVNANLVLSGIFGLVDSVLIFRESRKCLHDNIADTQVIKL